VGVELTDKGRRLAVQVVRRHRLSECLLANILRIEWEKFMNLLISLSTACYSSEKESESLKICGVTEKMAGLP
jgi:hypothetical protein